MDKPDSSDSLPLVHDVPVCSQCGKPVRNPRAGSITSWLFSASVCRCQGAPPKATPAEPALTLAPKGTLALKLHDDFALSQGAQTQGNLDLPELNEKIAQNFTFIKRLGEGGMGTVFLVRERATNEEFALKLINKEWLTDQRAIKRFNQEALAVRGLVHPNHVLMRDYAVPLQGAPYILMDYVKGVDLATVLARHGPLSTEEAIDVFIQVSDALAYAHGKDIVHRDIKPSNIIISTEHDHVVKVVDFGIAKMLRSHKSSELTEADEIIGTPYYMSPEQCQGDPLDARSDIYSLGCVMYEALCGRPPFARRNPVKVILQHLGEKAQSLHESFPALNIPATLESVIFKCMEKKPNDRYSTAKSLRDDLITVRAGGKPRIQARLRIPGKHGTTVLLMLISLVVGASGSWLIFRNETKTLRSGEPKTQTSPISDSSDVPAYAALFGNKRLPMLFANKDTIEVSAEQCLGLDDEGVAPVKDLHKLQSLSLFSTGVTSKCLVYLRDLPLTNLVLANTAITDQGMENIANIKSLQFLSLDGTVVTGESLKILNKLPNLQGLHLNGTKVRDGDLALLEPLRSLKDLDVANCSISDAAAPELARLPIETLDLKSSRLTNKGLEILSTSKTLRYLSLCNDRAFTGKGLASVAKLPLVVLSVQNTQPAKSGMLSLLGSMHTLRLLYVGASQNLDAGAIAALKQQLPRCHILVTSSQHSITDLKKKLMHPDSDLQQI